jgi:hypothetical protein
VRYIQPFGSTDIDGPYVNGNPVAGLNGSKPPAEMVEHPLRELVSVINYSGIAPNSSDLEQVAKAVRTQRLNFAIDIGAANALVVNFSPTFTELTSGLPLHVFVAFNNTGSSTIVVNGIGPTYIVRANGASLTAGDLLAGQIACLVYDGAFFQLQNYFGHPATNIGNHYYKAKIPYVQDTSSVTNQITANFSPAITSLAPGLLIEVKIAHQNTGAVSIYVNALSVRSIKAPSPFGMQELSSGQITVGMVVLLVYDGTQFQLVSNPATNRLAVDSGIQLVKRYSYLSPNRVTWGFIKSSMFGHAIPSVIFTSTDTKVFDFSYAPVAAGNRLRIQVSGAFGYEATICPRVSLYLAYSINEGQWIPAQFPGWDFPEGSTGQQLMANVAVLGFLYQSKDYMASGDFVAKKVESFNRNFVISAHLTIPEGPPSTIKFGLFYLPKDLDEEQINPEDPYQPLITHVAHGGIISQVYEYTR